MITSRTGAVGKVREVAGSHHRFHIAILGDTTQGIAGLETDTKPEAARSKGESTKSTKPEATHR